MQLHNLPPPLPAPVFAALGDATRLSLMGRLGSAECTLSALSVGTGMTRQAVTKHLDVLARAGLVQDRRRGRERLYRVNAAPLREVADWVEQYRLQWEAALDRLDDFLHNLPPTDKNP